MNFFDAWWYLYEHKAFSDFNYLNEKGQPYISAFLRLLDIDVQYVDPITKRIEDDTSRNTFTQVWLELGVQYQDETLKTFPDINDYVENKWLYNSHDMNLDCGGDTFEEAIINLALLVEEFYPIKDYGKIEEY